MTSQPVRRSEGILFTDYYHRNYGITDHPDITEDPILDAALLEKLRLS